MLGKLIKRSWDIYSKDGILILLQSAKSFMIYNFFKIIRNIKKFIIFGKTELKYKIQYRFDTTRPDIIYVDPQMIQGDIYHVFKNKTPNKEFKDCTLILGGDWDQKERCFFNSGREKYEIIHKSLIERYELDNCWENTGIYEYIDNNKINDARYKNSNERFEELDDIYYSMKEHGWSENKSEEYMYVAISREGNLFRITNGNHRFRMSKILNLEEIPVKVGVRHSDWQQKRLKASKLNSVNEVDPELEPYINHPDIKEVLNKNIINKK